MIEKLLASEPALPLQESPESKSPPCSGLFALADLENLTNRQGGQSGISLHDLSKRSKHHMLSIITWPKPEHDTCVAPSIRRAKS